MGHRAGYPRRTLATPRLPRGQVRDVLLGCEIRARIALSLLEISESSDRPPRDIGPTPGDIDRTPSPPTDRVDAMAAVPMPDGRMLLATAGDDAVGSIHRPTSR
jgi:hypothetical protein